MPRCTIIAGAIIKDYKRALSYIKEDDFIVYCDGGLYHKDKLEKEANLIVGDFDSHPSVKSTEKTEVISLSTMKDDTDSMYAIKNCIERGFDDFLLLGVSGGRLDHSLVNIYALLYLANRNKKALLVTDNEELFIISNASAYIENCKYFSLINITGKANDVTIKDAKYSIEHKSITSEYQYAVSNEVESGKQRAFVQVSDGQLLVIRTLRS